MYTFSPREEERYYLQVMLLYNQRTTSFEDLRTVNGITYPMFKDAARAAGYLNDNNKYRHSVQEGSFLQMPSEMRPLFAYAICFDKTNDAPALWIEFKTAMSDDYRHRKMSEQKNEA
ncbi:uncharacterized protein LOC136087033 [Hydra vulgaris]|uniref:Uncharacterized protein LOC136087033 n=1 Tax=Hydra vulgaris TaxID=6087 RepID=A0ABM4CUK9_HYDVU